MSKGWKISCEHPGLLWEIERDGAAFILRLYGGDWQLMQNGAVIANIGRRQDHFKALDIALHHIEKI